MEGIYVTTEIDENLACVKTKIHSSKSIAHNYLSTEGYELLTPDSNYWWKELPTMDRTSKMTAYCQEVDWKELVVAVADIRLSDIYKVK